MSQRMYEEIEIKYRLTGPSEHDRLRRELLGLGARPGPTRTERNVLFDTPTGDLADRGSAFRMRVTDGGEKGKLTYKGPAQLSQGIKTRQEVEVEVSDAAQARQLLEALGYRETIAYTTHREPWQMGNVEVVLDVLDFGHFCELEGPREDILALSRRLGLEPEQAEPATYPELMARHAAGRGQT